MIRPKLLAWPQCKDLRHWFKPGFQTIKLHHILQNDQFYDNQYKIAPFTSASNAADSASFSFILRAWKVNGNCTGIAPVSLSTSSSIFPWITWNVKFQSQKLPSFTNVRNQDGGCYCLLQSVCHSPCFHERCLPWFCFYFTEVKFLVV